MAATCDPNSRPLDRPAADPKGNAFWRPSVGGSDQVTVGETVCVAREDGRACRFA